MEVTEEGFFSIFQVQVRYDPTLTVPVRVHWTSESRERQRTSEKARWGRKNAKDLG